MTTETTHAGTLEQGTTDRIPGSMSSAPSPLSQQAEYGERTGAASTAAMPGETPSRDWFVPLDAEGDATAALEFARWLGAGNVQHVFQGVNLTDAPGAVGLTGDGDGDAAPYGGSQASSLRILDRIVDVDDGASPAGAIEELNERGHAQGLVVPRRADANDPALVRLGSFTRKLVSSAAMPIVIVPHDLHLLQISSGPVMVAVEPGRTPGAAASVAAEIAEAKHLPMVLVTVAQISTAVEFGNDAEELRDAYQLAEREAKADLIAWAAHHGVEKAWRHVVRGDVRFAIEHAARRFDASIIICGTRQRSIVERLLSPSSALELARYSARPVALIPQGVDTHVS